MRFVVHRSRNTACGLVAACLLAACGGTPAPAGGGGDAPFDPPLAHDVRLDTDPPGAALSVFPRIAAAGDRCYVVWYDRRDGRTDIYLNRSLDAGAHWLAADRRLDTDAPGAASSNVPALAAAGDRVYVAWEDTRDGLSSIRFNRSLDAGATWLAADVRLDRGSPDGSSFEVDVAAVEDRVLVVWEDDRDGEPDVYLNRSEDAGATWLAEEIRLDTDGAGAGASLSPRIAAEGDRVLVVWQDARDGAADVRLNASRDGGATWFATDRRLDTDVSGDAASLAPRIALSGSIAVAVWQDERSGVFEIRGNRSIDGGLTWSAVDVGIDRDPARTTDARRPALALLGSRVLVAWEDERNGFPDVYANRSLDGGATWLDEDRRLDTDPPGTGTSLAPAAALTPARAFVAFADDRKGRFDALLRISADGGDTWRAKEIRLDAGEPGAANALAPDLVGAGEEARVVTYDDRDGEPDVYFNRAR